ncbi:hypothetical protein CFE65_13900 [Acinetobacter baumannii]|nr:hypothetical protein CFE65_13900 [Acinetobacter baumannii]
MTPAASSCTQLRLSQSINPISFVNLQYLFIVYKNKIILKEYRILIKKHSKLYFYTVFENFPFIFNIKSQL